MSCLTGLAASLACAGVAIFFAANVVVFDGEAVLVRNTLTGEAKAIVGPATMTSLFTSTERMRQLSANQNEYLRLTHVNGTVEHLPGPVSVWHNPLELSHALVIPATSLTANEVLVVYRGGSNEANMKRLIIRGPALHVPTADEITHEFLWHGSVPGKLGRVEKKLKRFTKLRAIPTQLYYDVDNVRTNDEAVVTLKLMIFFNLEDIELMLNTTHDPIGKLIAAVQADSVAFASRVSYTNLTTSSHHGSDHQSATQQLSMLETYPQLTSTAKRIGIDVSRIVYRGCKASEQLQRMAVDAIERRQQLRLTTETEQMAQNVADLKLKRQAQRAEAEREAADAEAAHDRRLQRLDAEQKADILALAREAELDTKRQWLAMHEEAGVNLTALLVAQERNPDMLLRVQNGSEDVTPLHIHTTM